MIYVINNSNNPYFNHAAEEHLLYHFEEEIFMLWTNRPSILIGRNQNTISEINSNYVESNNIDVVRRLSGGGAVYNDLGNINFTFITNRITSKDDKNNGFERFAIPVIQALKTLGIKAEFTGRNDITINNKKISGNAQYFHKNKLLHHGTLLYNCNLHNLSKVLVSKSLKFKGKGIKSVASRVTNISDHLNKEMDLLEFKDYFMNFVIKRNNITKIYDFTNKDIEKIEEIMESRFKTWEWNYGNNLSYSYENAVKYPSGSIEYHLNVNNGIIKNISLHGDFFGEKNIKELESKLIGIKYNLEDLKKVLNQIPISQYIQGVSEKEFLKGLIDVSI